MVYWVKLNLPFLFFVTYLLVICPCLPQTNFGTHVQMQMQCKNWLEIPPRAIYNSHAWQRIVR